uniref:Uncharacterized protein n=1 Tax=Wuchereria bancrofti TaxID=6293 RepID=A0AAF5PN24_WUCBA
MQCFWHYYTTILLLIKVLVVKSIASMICPNGYANNEFYSLLYGLSYGTLAQICPPDNFFFSYVCCDQGYFECCIKFELWLIILMIIMLISISFCCFCFLFAGILYVRQKMEM